MQKFSVLPKRAWSAQTVENSHSFFYVSYTWYKALYYYSVSAARKFSKLPSNDPRLVNTMDNLLHDDSLDEMFGIPNALPIALYMGAIAAEN